MGFLFVEFGGGEKFYHLSLWKASCDKDVIEWFLLIPRFIYIYFNEGMDEKSHGRINNTLDFFRDTGEENSNSFVT